MVAPFKWQSYPSVVARPRLSRAEQRQRTRAAVLKAAARVFPREGYHRASVDQIAGEAGLTYGAVYSNFGGKSDLFLAMYEQQMTRWVEDLQRGVGEVGTVERRTEVAVGQWLDYVRDQRDWFPLFIEFWAHAVQDPELRERFAAQYSRLRVAVGELIAASAAELDVELPIAPGELGVAVNALGNGLLLDKLLTPDAVPDDLYQRFLEVVFGSLATAERQ